jgi:hypothetical protein
MAGLLSVLMQVAHVLQALAVPVIAAVGTWIALQQMGFARVKLQHDLYDRRYAVFQAARDLLSEVIVHKFVSEETFRNFALRTGDAPFLLDDALVRYVTELRERASKHRAISIAMEALPPGPEKAAATKEASENFLWLVSQIDVLVEKFRPALMLGARTRSLST